MSNDNSTKTSPNIVPVSRRRFLNGTAGVLATTGVVLLPQQTLALDKPQSLEQMSPIPRDAEYRKVAEILELDSQSEDQIRRSIMWFEHMRDSNDLAVRVMRNELADRKKRSFAQIRRSAS